MPLPLPLPVSENDRALRQVALMLTWLGNETISLNRAFVDATGNVLSGLWLSWVMDQMPAMLRSGRGVTQGHDYVFEMSAQECLKATGITRAEQATCRKLLARMGLVSDDGQRGKTLRYTVHLDRLHARIEEIAAPLKQPLDQDQSWMQAAVRSASR